MRIFTSHGGRGNEGRVQVDGLNVGAAFNGGGVSGFIMDTANAQELQVTLSGGLGEAETGGINMNVIPKTGGNMFSGQIFGSNAGSWSQGDNIDDELQELRHPESADASQVVGSQRIGRRADQAGQGLVLGHVSGRRLAHGRRRVVREQERRRCIQVELRGGHVDYRAECDGAHDHERPRDGAGHAAQQGRLLS